MAKPVIETFNNTDELALSLINGSYRLDFSMSKKEPSLGVALFKQNVGDPIREIKLNLTPDAKALFELPEVQALFGQGNIAMA
jgi:hypothetical protein